MTVPQDSVSVRRKSGRTRAARRAARGGALSNSRQCKARPAAPELPLPAKLPAAPPTETAAPRTRCREQGAVQLPGIAAAGQAPEAPPAEELRKGRSVSFDLEAVSEHEVTPYAEIYGLHPSDFQFASDGFVMLLTDADCSDEDEDDSEDGEEDDEYMAEDSWVMVDC